MTLTRTAAIVLAVALSAGPALAQTVPPAQTRGLAPSGGAAATLPNTFDGPVASRAAIPAPTTTPPQVTEADMAVGALRLIIDQIRAGDLDESLFTPSLAIRLNGQLATYTPMLQAYGEVQSIEAQGAQGGVGQFLVTFDNAATQWRIGLEDGGRVAALLFRETPPESSEPTGS
ncbi:MAG: hypothetical protein V4701_00425 [Pseudomonadota bacterium]